MIKNPLVAGQMIIWNRGPGPIQGRHVLQVVGLVGVDPVVAELFNAENIKRLVTGHYRDGLGIDMVIHDYHTEEVDCRGRGASELLTAPIWRIG